MKSFSIKNLDKKVSQLIYGCANSTMLQGLDNSYILDASLDAGINTFDTARGYGNSEVSLGDWINKRKAANNIVLITKGCHPDHDDLKDRVTAEDIKKDVETSLKALRVDYIDIYLLHRDDVTYPAETIIEALNELHKAGKIGAIGASNWTHQRMETANQYADSKDLIGFTVSEPNYGLPTQVADPWEMGSECITISGSENKDIREWYLQNDMPVFAYSSLGRGMFGGRIKSSDPEGAKLLMDPNAIKGYWCEENFERLKRAEQLAAEKGASVPQIALAWLMNQDLQVHPIVSFTKPEHLDMNVKSADIVLTKEEINWLDLRE